MMMNGKFVVLLRDGLLSRKQQIELEVFAIGQPIGKVDVHAGLDSTFDVLAVHWTPAVNIANKGDYRGRNDGRLYTRLK